MLAAKDVESVEKAKNGRWFARLKGGLGSRMLSDDDAARLRKALAGSGSSSGSKGGKKGSKKGSKKGGDKGSNGESKKGRKKGRRFITDYFR